MRDYPLIYSGRATKRTKATSAGAGGKNDHTVVPPPEVTEHKGDLLICDLWQQGTDSVHNMRVVNTDALTYMTKDPERFMHKAERKKKQKYLEACLQQRRHFSPFIASVDGLLGVEATATLKRLAVSSTPRNLSTKATKGEKCLHCWRHASRYFCFFFLSAYSRHFYGVFTVWVLASLFMTRMS